MWAAQVDEDDAFVASSIQYLWLGWWQLKAIVAISVTAYLTILTVHLIWRPGMNIRIRVTRVLRSSRTFPSPASLLFNNHGDNQQDRLDSRDSCCDTVDCDDSRHICPDSGK